MKLTKSNFGWIFATFGLCILLIISVYLGVSGWYFKNDLSYTTDLEIGKSICIGIKENQANAVSFNLDGSYLNGFKLPQIVSVRNSSSEKDIFLRAKVYVYTSDSQVYKMNIDNTANWTYNLEDDYYYFNSTLAREDKVALCSSIAFDEEGSYVTNVKYIVTFVFETLSSSEDVERLWGINLLKDLTNI